MTRWACLVRQVLIWGITGWAAFADGAAKQNRRAAKLPRIEPDFLSMTASPPNLSQPRSSNLGIGRLRSAIRGKEDWCFPAHRVNNGTSRRSTIHWSSIIRHWRKVLLTRFCFGSLEDRWRSWSRLTLHKLLSLRLRTHHHRGHSSTNEMLTTTVAPRWALLWHHHGRHLGAASRASTTHHPGITTTTELCPRRPLVAHRAAPHRLTE